MFLCKLIERTRQPRKCVMEEKAIYRKNAEQNAIYTVFFARAPRACLKCGTQLTTVGDSSRHTQKRCFFGTDGFVCQASAPFYLQFGFPAHELPSQRPPDNPNPQNMFCVIIWVSYGLFCFMEYTKIKNMYIYYAH